MQAISSAVCGAVVSAFSEVLNIQADQNRGQSSTGAVRPQPAIQTTHPSVSSAITFNQSIHTRGVARVLGKEGLSVMHAKSLTMPPH